MAGYITEADYTARFGTDELEQVMQSGTAIAFDKHVDDASAIVDSYLAAMKDRAFVIPLVLIPKRIIEVTADLTRYEIHAKQPTKEITERRKQAMAFLTLLVKGSVALPELLAPLPDPFASGSISVDADERVFTSDSLRGYAG